MPDLRDEIASLARRVAAQDEIIADLRKALEPVKAAADRFDGAKWQDHEDHWDGEKAGLNVGHLRAARAAYLKSKGAAE